LKKYNIAIVGATGLVGQEIIKILEARSFPAGNVYPYSSGRSAGSRAFINHNEVVVRAVTPESFRQVDIALFAAGAEVSLYYSPIAKASGALVIDSGTAFRMYREVPLIVPEVNAQDIKNHNGIIASPNSATIQLVTALYPLHKVNPIKRIIMATYESVSGSGAAAMNELTTQTKAVLEGRNVIPHIYHHQIAFNVFPEIDVFLDDGYTREEWKIIEETRKILHTEEIAISVTCVRAPVYIGYSEAVNIEFTSPMSPDEAKNILSMARGIKVLDDPSVSLYPQPWPAAGSNDIFVGRIRKDVSHPNGLVMWIVTDNLRKGGALNSIQIAEEMINNGWL